MALRMSSCGTGPRVRLVVLVLAVVALLLALATTVTFILFLAQLLTLRPLLVTILLQMLFGYLVRIPVRMVRATVSRQFIRQQNLTIDLPDDEDAGSLIAAMLAIEILRRDRYEVEARIPIISWILRLIN